MQELCLRRDPDEEPYRSKYLAREALKIGVAKLAPHASDAAKTAAARLQWRIGGKPPILALPLACIHHHHDRSLQWRIGGKPHAGSYP